MTSSFDAEHLAIRSRFTELPAARPWRPVRRASACIPDYVGTQAIFRGLRGLFRRTSCDARNTDAAEIVCAGIAIHQFIVRVSDGEARPGEHEVLEHSKPAQIAHVHDVSALENLRVQLRNEHNPHMLFP